MHDWDHKFNDLLSQIQSLKLKEVSCFKMEGLIRNGDKLIEFLKPQTNKLTRQGHLFTNPAAVSI